MELNTNIYNILKRKLLFFNVKDGITILLLVRYSKLMITHSLRAFSQDYAAKSRVRILVGSVLEFLPTPMEKMREYVTRTEAGAILLYASSSWRIKYSAC